MVTARHSIRLALAMRFQVLDVASPEKSTRWLPIVKHSTPHVSLGSVESKFWKPDGPQASSFQGHSGFDDSAQVWPGNSNWPMRSQACTESAMVIAWQIRFVPFASLALRS